MSARGGGSNIGCAPQHRCPLLLVPARRCKGGQQCAIGNTLIKPGAKGGVQVGNSDNTYKTGAECTATYQALIDGYVRL